MSWLPHLTLFVILPAVFYLCVKVYSEGGRR
jgi:hypothetical protein